MNKDGFGFEDEFTNEPALFKPIEPKSINRDLATYPKKIQQTAVARTKYLQWISKRLIGGWTEKNLTSLLKDIPSFEGEKVPSWRTLARWHKLYVESGGNILSLVPRHDRKGNRNTLSETDKFFEMALNRYRTKERLSVAAVYRYYKDLITLENDSVISTPLKALSYKAFKNRIDSLPQYDLMVDRYGKRLADIEFAKVDSHTLPLRPLERVEIDHTPLDVILLDDETLVPLGRANLTLLMDVYSRCIIGFHIGFKSPGYIAVMQAIRQAMIPKESIVSRYSDITGDWPCHGKIGTLVVDNACEFWCESLDSACRQVVTNIQFNKIERPWHKPFVEGAFKTINNKYNGDIPGKTFSNIAEKHDYDPKKYAHVRFSTYVHQFHKWVIDVYHKEPDSRYRYIPYELWQEGNEKTPVYTLDAQEIEDLDVVLGITTERTIRKGGITYEHIRYDSDELSSLRKLMARNESRKVTIKINPNDLSEIYVFIKGEDGYITVPSVSPKQEQIKGLSLDMHKINVRLLRDNTYEKVDEVSLAKARLYINERIEEEVKEVSQALRKAKVKGVKAIARAKNINNENLTSIAAPALPLKNKEEIKTDQPKDDDNWDDFVSDLEAF
ncbi:Mu transposase C-terminal domain-containing protein [Pseudoalteromonas maricaloris]|uniref:Mu transposase C-terminal domain-containing protein n=1 Tax=Pseudoalteromonas maricaloris TaxID=184924 RepID=UPI00029A49EB|nr:Mu transposase C-terminal domain-containing protein [Pseudoalteromonas flavipulchra]